MKFYARLLIIVVPLVVVPLVVSVVTTVLLANARTEELIDRIALLELDRVRRRAEYQHGVLEQLGLDESPIYRRSAQRDVVRSVDERERSMIAVIISDRDGELLTSPTSVGPVALTRSARFDPWGWTIEVAVSRSLVDAYVGRTTRTAALVLIAVGAPALVLLWLLTRRVSRPVTQLERSLQELEEAQELLVQRERMASLGGLVAGIAHEINTPIGIGVTSSTYLRSIAGDLERQLRDGVPDREALETFLRNTTEGAEIIYKSLQRAEELLRTFKQLAVDQTIEQPREFELCAYLHDIVHTLEPRLRSAGVSLSVECEGETVICSFPGTYYQILSNLILNSIVHGFDDRGPGSISIHLRREGETIVIVYTDDGAGMDEVQRRHVYEPFFTTRAGGGGSGLGMNIVFNTVNHRLGGTIDLESSPGHGVRFTIRVPRIAPNP